jgi:hypothetical protein
MKKTLLLLLTLSLFFACNKDDDGSNHEVPNDKWTAEDNIFRCKINGVDWEPAGNNLGFSDDDLDIYYEKFFLNAIQIRANKEVANINEILDLGFSVSSGIIGSHSILNNNLFTNYNCGNYYIDTVAQNIVNIEKIDSIYKIIEGNFHFTANEGSNSTCITDKITVTDGYFKTKYRN